MTADPHHDQHDERHDHLDPLTHVAQTDHPDALDD